MTMIDHTGIGVADVATSAAFYDAALGVLGMRRVVEMPDQAGIAYGMDHPIFWIDKFHPHGMKQHTAFRAASNEQVNASYEAGLRAGARDNGKPGLRSGKGYPPGYYAAFLLDHDGNNIEAVCRG